MVRGKWRSDMSDLTLYSLATGSLAITFGVLVIFGSCEGRCARPFLRVKGKSLISEPSCECAAS
jgi:hypothetical protein